MKEILNDETFFLYCAKNYDGGLLSTVDDFNGDLNRIKYIKKLITRYQQNGILKERLILNHIIVLNNVFGAEPTAKILYLKLMEDFNIIKPFLVTIGIMPRQFINIGNEEIIDTDLIPMDQNVVERLRVL